MTGRSHRTGGIETSGLAAAILNLPLPVTCDSVGNASVEKFTPENVGVAAGIFVLAPTEAEMPLGGNLPPASDT